MAVDRVSTYALFQSTLRDATAAQNNLFNLQTQLSSGIKAQDFASMSDQAQQFLDLENKISRSDQYIAGNNLVQTRVAATNTVLDQVIDIASNLRNLILTRRNESQGTASFAVQLRSQWEALVGQLNINTEGRYLFSGTRTDVPPVNAEDFPRLVTQGVPDNGYYQGSSDDVTARVDDNIAVTYNVRADDEAFQKIFAGLAMAQIGHTFGGDGDLAAAYDLVSEGIEGVTTLQASVNSNKVEIDKITDRHKSLKLYWQGIKEDVGNTDIVSVSTQVAINQGILQATFSAFAKINSLRLSDFLR